MPQDLSITSVIRIPLNRPHLTGQECHYVEQAIQSRSLGGEQAFALRCQRHIEAMTGCSRAFLTPSGTAALELAALLCDIQPGDEVIMPSFTFPSTANAFVLRGATPVFIDIDTATLNLDTDLVTAALTPRTRAIVAVHYGGIPCNMDHLEEITAAHGLWLIEDAAHAFGARLDSRWLGNIGHIGCFSFHETKDVVAGEAGALLTSHPRLIERAEIMREKGTNRTAFLRGDVAQYEWHDVGSSFLSNELTAGFLLAQLESAGQIFSLRRDRFCRYVEAFKDLESDGLFRHSPTHFHDSTQGKIFYLILNSATEKSSLMDHLQRAGIEASGHYVPLHSSAAGLRFGRIASAMTHTDDLSRRLLRLPLFAELTDEDLNHVTHTVKGFFSAHII